ncbi:hypothetical protein GQ43DRAFT_367291 [Delitschia confertaspora ATCC 74209]|uniref:LPS glycosyltransferase n=1 Tax=Delitschia confertaspora ATCC 74209 TaxID=1513339 RepID=A0A9P4JQE7_9PLEO|nr:hypothetical protein GQ43DRAFT_367291 [Delitschia confertaspora ATCC 74209]
MLVPRKRPIVFLAVFVFLFALYTYHRETGLIYPKFSDTSLDIPDNSPANKTLGFGAILVVSKEGSSRRHGLLQAANVTDIELTIPKQPSWTEEEIDTFRNGIDKAARGSILAWMGHHNALRWFLDSGLETALILEDDVDWDIRLRSVQAPLAATAVRKMLPPAKPFSPFQKAQEVSQNHTQYWGNPTSWDLLYLGHCGDYFGEVNYEGLKKIQEKSLLDELPHSLYEDPSLPVKSDLHPFTEQLFAMFDVPDHTRFLHRSKFPLCTFGYAVSRAAAERLLTDLAPSKLRPGGPRAFDVAVLHACNAGAETPSPTSKFWNPNPHPDPKLRHKYASKGLRCWTINPEFFHHMPGGSQIAEISEALGHKVGIPPVDFAGQLQVTERNETSNIGCGFWGGAFGFDENDNERLAFLQEEVGRKGRCLKEGRT